MANTVTRTQSDTLLPLNSIISIGDDPLNLADFDEVVFRMTTQSAPFTVICNNLATIIQPTSVFTANATTDRLTKVRHGIKAGDQVILASAGTLPLPLVASVPYFARDVSPNEFGLAATPEGAAIDLTTAGTGQHTYFVVGSVQFDFAAEHVASPGFYTAYFVIVDGGERQTVPYNGATLTVQIVGRN